MADWFIATEGVKVVKDSTSLWPQIITAVSSAGAARAVCIWPTTLPAGVKKERRRRSWSVSDFLLLRSWSFAGVLCD